MATRMQQRRGTAATWTAADPILAAGEIGFETDTNKFKIGDGSNRWAQLVYFTADAAAALEDLIDGAPGVLNTLNELAAAINDDPNFFSTVATNLSNHEADTTNVHGIANTANLVTLAGTQTLTNKTLTSPVINTPTGITKSDVGLSNVDNTSDANKPVSTAQASAISSAQSGAEATAAAALASHEADTTGVHGIADTANLVTKTGSETLTNKTISHTDNTITLQISNLSDITASAAELNLLDGVTANTTELNYVDGVTSGIQTQLDSKAALNGANFTGAITSTSPISTTDSTPAISTSSGSIVAGGGLGVAGNAYVGGNLVISGNFEVNGTTTTVSTQDLVVSDPIIYVGESNNANTIDLGIVASFDDGTYQHTGLVRDASAGTWKLFKGITDEPTTTVNFAQGSLDDLSVGGLSATSLTVGDVSNTEIGYLNGVTSAIQTQIDNKISASSSDTLTNKTIDLASNALSGTISQFNSVLSDADFATLDGTETLSNKTVSYTNNTITVQVANISDVTASASELNVLDGITASTSELNILDGVTASTSEINILDGVTASTAELNILDGLTVSAAELNYIGGATSGIQGQLDLKAPLADPTFTGTVVLPGTTSIGDVSSSEIGILNGLTASTAELNILDGVTASTQELNILDGVTASASELNLLDGVTATTTELNYIGGVTSSIQNQLNTKAPLADPALTGIPTAPTAALNTNTTQIATTAFVDAAIEALASRNLILDGGGV